MHSVRRAADARAPLERAPAARRDPRGGVFFAFLGVAAAAGVLNSVGGAVQARVLGPQGQSVLAYSALALGTLLVASNGLEAVTLLQVGRDRTRPLDVHRALLLVCVLTAIPVALAILGFALVDRAQRPLLSVAIALPAAVYVQGARGILLALGRTRPIVLQTLIPVLGGAAVIPLLLYSELSPYQALALWTAGQFAAAAYTFFVCARIGAEKSTGEVRPIGALVRQQLKVGVLASGARFTADANLRIDLVLIANLMGAAPLAVYSVAIATAGMLWSYSTSLLYTSLDGVAALPLERSAALTARLMRSVVPIELLLALLIAVFAKPVIDNVYGEEFGDAAEIIRLLIPALLGYGIDTFLTYFIVVRLERSGLLVVVQTITTAICVALTVALMPAFGLRGAAAATSLTFVAAIAFKLWYFRRETGIGYRAQLLPRRSDVDWTVRLARRGLRGIAQRITGARRAG